MFLKYEGVDACYQRGKGLDSCKVPIKGVDACYQWVKGLDSCKVPVKGVDFHFKEKGMDLARNSQKCWLG